MKSISSANSLQEWGWNKDILLQRKIKRNNSQHIYSKRIAKGSSSDNKNNIGRKLGISEMKNNKNGKYLGKHSILLLRSFKHAWEFPGIPVVRILGFHHCGLSSVLDWGTVISQATWHGQKKKKKKKNRIWLIVESKKFNTDDINMVCRYSMYTDIVYNTLITWRKKGKGMSMVVKFVHSN